MNPVPVPWLALAVAGFTLGCATLDTSSHTDPTTIGRTDGATRIGRLLKDHEERAKTRAPSDPREDKLTHALELSRSAHHEAALHEIQSLISQEAPASDGLFAAQARAAAIDIVREYQKYHGYDVDLDRLASDYYSDAVAITDQASISNRERREVQALVDYTYGTYFSHTNRNGDALPYMLRELAYRESRGDTYHVVKALDALANIYNDMGDLSLRDAYRERSGSRAKSYFRLGRQPSEVLLWQQYIEFLFHRASDVAPAGRTSEVRHVWKQIEPIVDRYPEAPRSSHGPFLRIAEYLAAAGSVSEARAHYREGARRADTSDPTAQIELACKGATITLAERRYPAAASEFDRCLALRRAAGRRIDPGTARLSAQAFEAVGNLDRAIQLYRESTRLFERTRESYTVSERATFFRSQARQPYWGLIRASLRRYQQTGAAADFANAISTSDLVRARQLGDSISANGEATITPPQLAALRGRLGDDEVVIDYLLTDTAIVVLAFTKDESIAEIIPYDRREFQQTLRSIARDLSDRRSSTDHLDQQLGQVGELLLAPVAKLLDGRRRIIALPDGVLNLIPFELLRHPGYGGEPLLARHTVRAVPSIRFLRAEHLQRERASGRKLFALADPDYGGDFRVRESFRQSPSGRKRGLGISSYFERLPETSTEVAQIAELFGQGDVDILSGSSATESALKSRDLSEYGFVHFATHGILGNEVPGILEPALVLAEEDGEDGFLTASEAEKLSLRSELTALSACKTGSGDYLTGEGVMGMGRAFLIAGSKSVLVSLWEVDSKATEDLMVEFYRRLTQGEAAATALRGAKRELSQQRGTRPGSPRNTNGSGGAPAKVHPYYWAGFVLIGS